MQYPGREDRAVEPCITNIPDLADQIHAALRPSLPGTFAFFGHSMGAILAFELARRIAREEGRGPRIRLCVRPPASATASSS